MATKTITDLVSLTSLPPMNLKSSQLRRPSSVGFSNLGRSIAPRLVVATTFNKHLSGRSSGRNLGLGRVRAGARDEEGEKKPTTTPWHYQLFSVLKRFIDWWFSLCFFVVFIGFATLWLMIMVA